MTTQTLAVLAAFLEDPLAERYGLEIGRETGLASGTLYPVLARLERDGLLASRWEDVDPVSEGRRPRRYYRLTSEGEQAAVSALEATARKLNLPRTSFRLRIPAAGA